MAKKQTRRSISVRGTTYYRLKAWCEDNGVAMSDFVEKRIAEHIGEATPAKAAVTRPAIAVARPSVAAPVRPTPRPTEAPRPVAVQPRPAVAAPRPAVAAPRPAVAAPRATVPAIIDNRPATSKLHPVRPSQPLPTAVVPTRPINSAPPVRPVEVARPVRTPTPPEPIARSAGRPAPTPASKVIKVAQPEPSDGTDYRAIRF